ncbi:MAG: sensor histidine kinase [Cyanobacteria bacterium P01_A01_bin.83]
MDNDLGKILLAKTNTIIEDWIASIREDLDVESAKSLTYKSVRNSIPIVLEALASLLSDSLSDRHDKLEDNGLEHGIVRAEQGYDVAEIMREYALLRQIIFTVLELDLLSGSKEEIMRNVRLIDAVIDRVISLSLESFVEMRLKELKELQSQLIFTNQELTRLIASQREDLSHLAHEMKTPLNSIMGFSTILLQQQKKMAQRKDTSLSLQLTEKVIKNSKQLLRLINDILEISRYEAGKMQANFEPIDVRLLIILVTEALEYSAEQKNLEIILDCDRAPAEITSDRVRLQQIVTNLVSNAIRYTESGSITVTCQTINSDRWVIAVADTGVGIAPEVQAQIFEPYFRVASKEGYSAESTGLGLSIVDKMVRLLQGNIELVSQIGAGSTFTVTFPQAIAN